MRPAELKTALEFWIGKRRPTWVEGPPGVGKTSIAQQVIDSLELEIAMFPPCLLYTSPSPRD